MAYKPAGRKAMRPLVIRNLSCSLENLIRKRAWREHISYEKAVVEFLTDAEIEESVQHDLAIVNAWFKENDGDDEFEPF